MDIRKFFGDTESVEERKLSFHSVKQLREMRGKITGVIDDLDKMILSSNLLSGGYEKSQVKGKNPYIAKRGRHLCKKVTGFETAYIFFVAKDEKEDYKWKNKETHWNVPRERIHDFCSKCRRIPEEEYREFGLKTHPKNECWECMCS